MAITSSLAFVRFHERNAEVWERRGVSGQEKFRYHDSSTELESWIPGILRMAEQARETQVLMNNYYSNYTVRDAQDLQGRLLG